MPVNPIGIVIYETLYQRPEQTAVRRANGKNIEFSQKKPIGSVQRTPYQKTADVNGTAVRHAEVGEGLERHLDQVSRTGSET